MQNVELDGSQAGIKRARRNINNLRYADDTSLMAKSEEELKRILIRVKEESEKAGLKLSIQKTKIMTSITLWQTEGGNVKKVTDFIFLGSKIKADGDCSHEIKRRLLTGRKAMMNLDRVLKIRDITLPTKVPGEGNGNPFQYSCLENPMDRGAWWATVHGVAKSQP